MKTLINVVLFIAVSLSHESVFSQSLGLSDLLKLNSLNEDDFDTFITLKGFKYDGFEEKDEAKLKSYVFYVNGIKTSYITKITYTSRPQEMISFQTPNSTTYLNIKGDIKKLGFIYVKTETYEQTTFMYYKKNNNELSHASSTDESRPIGTTRTFYEISITNSN
jgi:hypothetical protein